MPTFAMICLANSLKHGGRCIAGFKLDGSGWIRPVSPQGDGTLFAEHYTLANGGEPELLSIIELECDCPHSRIYQPENWQISDRPWKFIGWPTIPQLNQLLKKEVQAANHSPTLLGNQSDRVEWEALKNNPASRSLCLIKPKKILWKIDTFAQKRRFRAIFNLNGIRYNLSITDPFWNNLLTLLDDGEYSCQQVINLLNLEDFSPNNFLFTISLSEPFQPAEDRPVYCFKLVAAVINTTRVKAFFKQIEEKTKAEHKMSLDSHSLSLNRDLELSTNTIFFAVKPLIDRAIKTCWDSYPKEKRSMSILRKIFQDLLTQTLDDFEQNLDNSHTPAHSFLEQVRKKYPKAYTKWTIEDDEELCTLFENGVSIQELAQHFQRKPGAIRSRLHKLEDN